MDEVLFVVDLDSSKAQADPAFAAHVEVIGAFAEAVWRGLMDLGTLQFLVAHAKERLCRAKRQWSVVRGPVAAFVATANRIGWKVMGATQVIDENGVSVSFIDDSPDAIRLRVKAAVERWRMENVGVALGKDFTRCGGVETRSLQVAVREKRSIAWGRTETTYLRSTVAGKQWTQHRLHRAGKSEEAGCQLCKAMCPTLELGQGAFPGGAVWDSGFDVQEIGYLSPEQQWALMKEKLGSPVRKCCVKGTMSGKLCDMDLNKEEPELSAHEEEVAAWQPRAVSERGNIPRGTLVHMHWFCPVTWNRVIGKLRELKADDTIKRMIAVRAHAQGVWLRHWKEGGEVDRALWERGLAENSRHDVEPPLMEGTFHWKVRASREMMDDGDVFSDASLLDGAVGLGRTGWAFTVLERGTSNLVGSAYGVPP